MGYGLWVMGLGLWVMGLGCRFTRTYTPKPGVDAAKEEPQALQTRMRSVTAPFQMTP